MEGNSKELKTVASKRLYEVDVVKTFAIFFMVTVHALEHLSGIDFLRIMPDDALRNIVEFTGGPLVAPVFMFTMGIGMIYTRHNQPLDFIKRGVKLVIGGFVLNFFRATLLYMIADAIGVDPGSEFSTFETFFIADVLHFAGLAFILVGILRAIKLRTYMIFILSLLMLGGGMLTSASIEPCTVPSMLLGFITFTGITCAFPLMLWFVYTAAGMVFAEILKKTEDRSSLYQKVLAASGAVLVVTVVVLMMTGYDIRNIYTLTHQAYYEQDFIHLLVTLSSVLVELSLAFFVFRGVEGTTLGRFVGFCGVNLNTIYVFQWLLITATRTTIVTLELSEVGDVGIVPAGLILAVTAMGLTVLWNKVRKKRTASVKA